jgi:hypothetical protein
MAGDALIAAMMKVVGLNVMALLRVEKTVVRRGSLFVGIAIFAVFRP